MIFIKQQSRSVRSAIRQTLLRCTGLLHTALLLSLLATSGCSWLDVQQRQIIYRPSTGIPADFVGLRSGDERYFVTVPHTAEQRIELWWLPHAAKTAPTLLYFHGTFFSLVGNLHKMEALREAGFSVLAVDYRGWGASTVITPSEQSILQDADAAWAELQRREPRAAQRVIYGHSMGSGVAVALASRLQTNTAYGALILESAFTSFSDVAHEAGFLPRVLFNFSHERFDSLAKIGNINAPLLMLHGSLDTTIPPQLGARLFAAANPPKHWLTIEGGAHSDLDQVGNAHYPTALKRFINDYLTTSAKLHNIASKPAVEPSSPAVSPVLRRGSMSLASTLPSSTPH